MPDAATINSRKARLEAENTAKRSRQDGGAAGLRADRHRNHVIGDSGGRAARRDTRAAAKIVRIFDADRHRTCELGRGALAEDDEAGAAQQSDDGRIGCRSISLIDRRAVGRRHIEGIENVLDADRHTMKCAPGRLLIAARAWRRAISGSTKAQARMSGSRAAIRARQSSTMASDVVSPAAIFFAACVAESRFSPPGPLSANDLASAAKAQSPAHVHTHHFGCSSPIVDASMSPP